MKNTITIFWDVVLLSLVQVHWHCSKTSVNLYQTVQCRNPYLIAFSFWKQEAVCSDFKKYIMFDEALQREQQLLSILLSPFLHQFLVTDLHVVEATACSTQHLHHIAGYHADRLLRGRLPLTATRFQ
jgi:hypothetical protein